MTRKDFELIASTLKAERDVALVAQHDVALKLLDSLAHDFADRLRSTNQQFNRDRFLRACGVSP